MKPKLILINGPCAVGKNTIAERYASEHPMAVIVDIDEVRRTIDGYRENREESYKQACGLVFAKAVENLNGGNDVIVPNVIRKLNVLGRFENIAEECNADFYEFVLWTSKADAIARAIRRGFRPEGLLQADKLEGMFDELEETLTQRKDAIIIESIEGDIDRTYNKLLESVTFFAEV